MGSKVKKFFSRTSKYATALLNSSSVKPTKPEWDFLVEYNAPNANAISTPHLGEQAARYTEINDQKHSLMNHDLFSCLLSRNMLDAMLPRLNLVKWQ